MSAINIEEIMQGARVSWHQHATLAPEMRMLRVIADMAPEIADQALRATLPACSACGCTTPDDPDANECGCDAGCNDGIYPPGINQMIAAAQAEQDGA